MDVNKYEKGLKYVALEFGLMLLRILIFVLIVVGILIADAIIISLLTIPYYLLLIFLAVNLLYRFCLMRKRQNVHTDVIKNPKVTQKINKTDEERK